MKTDKIIEAIDRQTWLEPVDKTLQKGLDAMLNQGGKSGQKIRDAMHGKWLGHPIHPITVHVPIGAWTLAALFDAIAMIGGNKEDDTASKTADACVGIGLVAATSSAIIGLNDWQHTSNSARRVGTLHAVFNVGATILYLTSLILRRKGSREAGQLASFAGYALMSVGGYLGGTMIYDQEIGVNHAAKIEDVPADWTPVLPLRDLHGSELKRVEAGDKKIKVLLTRQNGEILAIGETCAHLGGPLSEGRIEDNCVRCPLHGSRFSLQDGEVQNGPSAFPVPSFETRITDGQIEIRARTSEPEEAKKSGKEEVV